MPSGGDGRGRACVFGAGYVLQWGELRVVCHNFCALCSEERSLPWCRVVLGRGVCVPVGGQGQGRWLEVVLEV